MLASASREAAAAVAERLEQVLDEVAESQPRWQLSEQLAAVAALLDRELALRRTLADAALPGEARARLADSLIGGQLEAPARDLLTTLVRQRWSGPIDLVDTVDATAASAAFGAAEASGALDEVEDELFRFTRILDRSGQLYAALVSTQLPTERKVEVVRALLGDGKAHDVTIGVVLRAVTNRRGRTLERALEEYLRLAGARRARLVATVTTALPLGEETTDRLRDMLGRLYRHDIQLQVEVDPDLLGGVVVRIGDEVIDGSVRHRLDQARRRLAG